MKRFDPRVLESNFAMRAESIPPAALPRSAAGFPQDTLPAGARAEALAYSPPGAPQQGTVQARDPRKDKPFAFALTNGQDGACIYFGSLLTSVTRMEFERLEVSGTMVNSLAAEEEIPSVERHDPVNLDTDYGRQKSTELGWHGDVYLYWECTNDGDITLCDIRGPEEPPSEPIAMLDTELHREGEGGKYWVKIGTVASNGAITQLVSSDVTWSVTIVAGGGSESSSSNSSSESSESSSSDESSSGKSSGGSSGESSGSDKSTAIVPAAWSPTGYAALFIAEMPEVRFDDVVTVTVRGRRQSVALDPRFTAVCEPGSIVLCGSGTDNGRAARVWIEERKGRLQLRLRVARLPWLRPGKVHVRLSGIRKGFAGKRFPTRTHTQFVANEAFINSAYPAS